MAASLTNEQIIHQLEQVHDINQRLLEAVNGLTVRIKQLESNMNFVAVVTSAHTDAIRLLSEVVSYNGNE